MELSIEFTTSVQTFAFIFFAGFLTSLTPCIFPMIPITLSVLGAQSLNQSKIKSFFISVIYVHGIATTYSILGLLAAKSGALFGSYLSNPWVIGSIAIIFILMGLSFYGLYHIQVPHFLRNTIGTKNFQKNYLGAYLSGLVAGIVASPCVGPVLVALLAHVAKSQNLLLGFLYLFTYAMGLGLIFVVLGTFSNLLNKIPRSGPWMNLTKFIFGSTLILMSAYYLKPILKSSYFEIYLGLLLILIAGINGLFETKKHKYFYIKKTLILMIFILGAGFTLKGFIATPIPTTPQSSQWISYSEDAISEAKGNKIVLIDFWAEWCEACHTLEKQTFSDPQVKAILDDFLLVKVDATKDQEPVSSILSKYDVTGLPFVMFIEKDGTIRADLTLTGYEPPSAFLKRLQQLKK